MQQFPDKNPGLAKKKTYFVEKIWSALSSLPQYNAEMINKYFTSGLIFEHYDFDMTIAEKCNPKIHTMRRKSKREWKKGTAIHYKIWTGKPYVEPTFAFAPTIPCDGTEACSVIYPKIKGDYLPYVEIGERMIFQGSDEMELLAMNDGFDSVEDFFLYFDESWDGEIIHWTPFRYDVNEIDVKDPETIKAN